MTVFRNATAWRRDSVVRPMLPMRATHVIVRDILLLAGAVFATYWIGRWIGFSESANASVFWIPNGVVFAFMIRRPMREWPFYLISVLVGKHAAYVSMAGEFWDWVRWIYGFLNYGEAALGALLVRRFTRGRFSFDAPRDVVVFALGAVLVAPAIATTFAASLQSYFRNVDFLSFWGVFFVGDSLGIVVAAPLVLAWWPAPGMPAWRRRGGWFEGAGLVAATLIVFVIIFRLAARSPITSVAPYAFLPLIAWAGVRFGRRGATTLASGIVACAVVLTFHGYGPFSVLSEDPNERVIALQSFSALYCLSALALTALLRQNEEHERHEAAAREMEALGQLAGRVAHDFNNELTVISGWSEMLAFDEPEGKKRDALDAIRRAARRSADLTHQLLSFSRQQAPVLIPTNLNDLVTEIGPTLQSALGDACSLHYDFTGESSTILADRHQLEIALVNLIVNARDAMPRGGTVRIETRLVPEEAGPTARDPWIALRVIDDGEGIPEAIRSHIFEPFFTTKEPGMGTGIGLTTVRTMVEKHGGELHFQSAERSGSIFELRFPRSAVVPERSEGVQDKKVVDRGARGVEVVLLVEDNPNIRSFLEDRLREHGYHVITATHGTDAIELAKDVGAIDLLVTDILMPGMTGPELAGKMRSQDPSVGLLYISGYRGESELRPSGRLLSKPFDTTEFLTCVRAVLDERAEDRDPSGESTPAIP